MAVSSNTKAKEAGSNGGQVTANKSQPSQPSQFSQSSESSKYSQSSSALGSISARLLQWLPILVCALPSILLLAFVPPTFNEIDSATLLTANLNFAVPHWPPLYPVFLFCNTFLFHLTDTAIYAILILQHLIAVAAAIYLTTAVSGTWRRLVMALAVCTANYFFIFSHGLFTEALSTPFFVFFIGAAARLALLRESELDNITTSATLELGLRSPAPKSVRIEISRRQTALIISFASLVLMTLARHNMFIFAALLPGLYIIRALLKVKGTNLKPFVVTMLISLAAFLTVHFTNEKICQLLGNDSTPLVGRVVTYRMGGLPWDTMPERDRVHLVSNMLKHCPDNFTRAALLVMIADRDPWMGSMNRIKALAPHFAAKNSANQAMNDASKAFFLTPNKYLVSGILKTFYVDYMESSGTFEQLMSGTTESIVHYQTGKIKTVPSMYNVHMIKQIDPKQYQRISNVINPILFDSICRYIPLGLLAIAIGLMAIARRQASHEYLALVLTLYACAIVYAAISSAVTICIPRYVTPVNVAVWIMLGLAIVSWQRFNWNPAKRS